jgi:hypothetical protein
VTSVPTDPDTFFDSYVRQSLSRIQGRLAGVSSPGAVVFRVGERDPVALRLSHGELQVSREAPPDTLVQVTLSEADFDPILVRGAQALESAADASDRQLAVFRALMLDAERAAGIRAVTGSLAVELSGERTHRLVLTPGTRTPSAAAECTVRCALSDFWAMQRGQSNPFELMMNGKIQISGDAQIVMVLSSLFV